MLWCAGKIANRLVSDDMFSEKVAANIERNIPQRLQNEGGITASAATQFHRGNFIVVLVSIEQIDLRKMLQSKLDEKKMKRFDQIMHYLEFFPSWVKVDLQNLILQEAGLLHSSKVLRVFSLDQSFACIHWPYIYIHIPQDSSFESGETRKAETSKSLIWVMISGHSLLSMTRWLTSYLYQFGLGQGSCLVEHLSCLISSFLTL